MMSLLLPDVKSQMPQRLHIVWVNEAQLRTILPLGDITQPLEMDFDYVSMYVEAGSYNP